VLNITSSNDNVDAIWVRYHYDLGSSLSSAWSGLVSTTAAQTCAGQTAPIGTDLNCYVACGCSSFDAVMIDGPDANGITTITFKVGAYCGTGISYIAFSDPSLTIVGPIGSATGSTTGACEGALGLSYQVVQTGTGGNPGFTAIKFSPGSGNLYKDGAFDCFTIKVLGWYPGYEWNLQAHSGGVYTTFTGVMSGCTCPQGGCTNSTTPPPVQCPQGYAVVNGQCSTTQCASQAPNGDVWFCAATGDPNTPWQLTAVKAGGPYPSGFLLGNSTSQLDPQGYVVDCQCKRTVVPCAADLSNCCGYACFTQNGTCNCDASLGADCCYQAPPPPQNSTTNTTNPPPPPTELPCYNNGSFCSGNGVCNQTANACTCNDGYEGANCSAVIPPPPTCVSMPADCTGCVSNPQGIACVWCIDVAGDRCTTADQCQQAALGCSTIVPYTPPPCQNASDCNNAGTCVNGTEGSYCQCDKNARGADCGGGGLSTLAKALAISGGIIAAIVIGALIVLGVVTFAGYKTAKWALLREQASAVANTNALYEAPAGSGDSAIYVEPGRA
jgi:hypothetical protein